jgi:hypothetical protein
VTARCGFVLAIVVSAACGTARARTGYTISAVGTFGGGALALGPAKAVGITAMCVGLYAFLCAVTTDSEPGVPIASTPGHASLGRVGAIDASGAPAGRIDFSRHIYDYRGVPVGRIDPDGHLYDRTGVVAGRIDSGGHIYDRRGVPAGRIDPDGHIHDSTGVVAGRIGGPCAGRCSEDAGGRLLLR